MDLYLRATLPTVIYVIRGDLSLAKSVDEDKIEIVGTAALRRRLSRWLNLSPLADVESQRRDRVDAIG
jgi:hypothetical protein